MTLPVPAPDTAYAGWSPAQLREALQARDQALAEQAAAQAAFVGAVAHDLRAPLRHFTAYGALVRELLQDALADPGALPLAETQAKTQADLHEALDFLATMDQSARRLGQMLDGLLALDRAARAPLRPAWQPLGPAVDRARAAVEAATPAVGATVAWDIAPQLPTLWADADLLDQLLQVLLANALKFSRTQPEPRIQVRPEPAEPGWVALGVCDNGVGFDPARASRLGEVFQRLHREADFPGVGAGLALARQIVARHRGRLDITARPGEGCTVRLAWPLPLGDAGHPGVSDA